MIKRYITSFFLVCMAMVAIAAQSPVELLQTTSNSMIDALKQHKATIKSDPAYVEGLARQILLPHVDVGAMSRLALGRDGWQKANAAQRREFTTQFTTLMIRTYSKALASYSNQSIQFLPLRGNIDGKSQIQIDSKIIQPGGPAIPMSYRMVLRDNQWKVYDMSVDGVSMVQSFRSQFSQELNQGGISGLLTAMEQRNSRRAKS